jgi:hypothetical protein
MVKVRNLHDSLIVSVLIILYSIPIVGDMLINGWPRIFSYFAADVFYYLTVAKNFAKVGMFSFDGIYPTNGFQPLWQLILGLVYSVAAFFNLSEPIILVGIFILCVILISASLVLIAFAMKNYYGQIPASMLILPVGLYAVLMLGWERRFGTLWSFTNGMETPLLILSFAILFFFFSKGESILNSRKHMLMIGIINGLLTLSRLDHGLLSLMFYTILLLYELKSNKREQINHLVVSIGVWIVIILLYLIPNRIASGMWLPISGSLKSTFPNPAPFMDKVYDLISILRRYREIDFGYFIWRYAQILIPVFVALPVGIASYKKIKSNQAASFDIFIGGLSFFVVLFGFYNFPFVPIFEQGHWYFPISIVFVSLVFIHISRKFLIPKNVWLFVGLSLVLTILFFTQIFWNPTHNELHRVFFLNASEVKGHFEGVDVKMIEFDDGIITYSTDFTALSGFGYSVDKEAARAMEHEQFFDLAYKRGYRYITSLYYFGDRFDYSTSSNEISRYFSSKLDTFHQKDLSEYSFTVAYKALDGRFSMIEMKKITDQ